MPSFTLDERILKFAKDHRNATTSLLSLVATIIIYTIISYLFDDEQETYYQETLFIFVTLSVFILSLSLIINIHSKRDNNEDQE